MLRIQVFINNQWEYLFCRDERDNKPIITKDRLKAQKGTNDALQYFSNKMASFNFRISK
jgi:hypothetical protein